MSKVKLTKNEFSRWKRSEPSLRFYLDVGMPDVGQWLVNTGYGTVIAERQRGEAASDEDHLYEAKKQFRIFVTKDIKRVKHELNNLYNCPGVIGIESSNPTQAEMIEGIKAILSWSTKWKDFYERAWIITHGSLYIFEADGTRRKIA